MKTFLKILLIVVLLYVAIKFSPVIFLLALTGLLVATVLGAVGLTLLVVLASIVLASALALAPIWVPVLIVLGLINLFRRERNVPPPMPA